MILLPQTSSPKEMMTDWRVAEMIYRPVAVEVIWSIAPPASNLFRGSKIKTTLAGVTQFPV